jgi:hypothetical protein
VPRGHRARRGRARPRQHRLADRAGRGVRPPGRQAGPDAGRRPQQAAGRARGRRHGARDHGGARPATGGTSARHAVAGPRRGRALDPARRGHAGGADLRGRACAGRAPGLAAHASCRPRRARDRRRLGGLRDIDQRCASGGRWHRAGVARRLQRGRPRDGPVPPDGAAPSRRGGLAGHRGRARRGRPPAVARRRALHVPL